MIKVGQIGIGHNHGAAVMNTIRRFPDLFEVIGYSEENEEWIRRRAGGKAYEGLQRMTEEEIIAGSDAVIVETDVWNLTSTAKKCIDAGKPVHMDKPASGTLEEYKALLEAAEKQGLPFQLGYMYRYNPAVIKCMEWQKEGRFGDIYSIHAEMNTGHDPASRIWHGNFNGGVHYILGSHLADLVVWFLGKPVKVTSFLGHSGKDGVDVPDNNLSVLEYPNALARIVVSSVDIDGHSRRSLVISGSQATASILPLEPPAMTWSDTNISTNPYENQHVPVELESNGKRYDAMMKDFYQFVTEKKENPFSYAHEYAVQEVLSEMVGGVQMLGHQI